MDFSQVAAEFRKLKAQHDADALSEAEFKTRLQDLMLQDEQGRWWMIGYETGQWYVHDGGKWVRAKPPIPGGQPTVITAPLEMPPVVQKGPEKSVLRPQAQPPRPWLRIGVGIVAAAVVIAVIAQLAGRPQPTPTPRPAPLAAEPPRTLSAAPPTITSVPPTATPVPPTITSAPPTAIPRSPTPANASVRIWQIGSPYDKGGDARPSPEGANKMSRMMAGLNLSTQISLLTANEFPAQFLKAKAGGDVPEFIIGDNYGPIDTVFAQDPETRTQLRSVGDYSFSGYFVFLVRDSVNYETATRFALRDPTCPLLTKPPATAGVRVAEIEQMAIAITTAYLAGDFDTLRRYFDDSTLLTRTRFDEAGRVTKTVMCGEWGNQRLAFIYTAAAFETQTRIGQSDLLVVLRNPGDAWHLLTITSDPISIKAIPESIPSLASSLNTTAASGVLPEPAVLLSPQDGKYPQPAVGQSFGAFIWKPSPSSSVVAEVAEFEYGYDTRLFFELRPSSTQVTAQYQISAGQLWSTRKTWHWRIWSISSDGRISLSDVRSFVN